MGLMRDRKLEDEYAKIFDDLGFDINVEDTKLLKDDGTKEEQENKEIKNQ